MVTRNQSMTNIKAYLYSQINTLSEGNPAINIFKPILSRVIDNNLFKIEPFLDLITDREGNIDIENIMEEMVQSLMTTEPFTLNTSFAGDIEIGGGLIKINIPLTDKRLVLNKIDIQNFRNLLINK